MGLQVTWTAALNFNLNKYYVRLMSIYKKLIYFVKKNVKFIPEHQLDQNFLFCQQFPKTKEHLERLYIFLFY